MAKTEILQTLGALKEERERKKEKTLLYLQYNKYIGLISKKKKKKFQTINQRKKLPFCKPGQKSIFHMDQPNINVSTRLKEWELI